MSNFDWNNIHSNLFNIDKIENKVNADKLFVSFLLEVEKNKIDIRKEFTIEEIANLIPKGTAGIRNNSTYGFSIMSMFSSQKDREYFKFEKSNLQDVFTSICNNSHDRDNYYWKKHSLHEKVKINQEYIKIGANYMGKTLAGTNEKKFISFFNKVYGGDILQGKCVYKDNDENVSISVDNSIDYENKKILIEIDSGNQAKLIVGQYVLLNLLCQEDKDVLFVVIHYYKDKKNKQYNPQRTISNLKLINKKLCTNSRLKFKVFNQDEFEKLCKENGSIKSLINSLYS